MGFELRWRWRVAEFVDIILFFCFRRGDGEGERAGRCVSFCFWEGERKDDRYVSQNLRILKS